MAKSKKSKNKTLQNKVDLPALATPSTMARKLKVSKKDELPSSPVEDDEHPYSSLGEEEDKEDNEVDDDEEKDDEEKDDEEKDDDDEEVVDEEVVDEEVVDEEVVDEEVVDEEVVDEEVVDEEVVDEEVADEEDGDVTEEEKNEAPLNWPKNDTIELLKSIRKALPKDDVMKYDSRVNHVNWEAIKFGDYSAEQCKTRWLDIQAHLRHYRLLAEVLGDAEAWVDRPWYNFNKGGKHNQRHPDQPKKPLTSYMLFYMEQKDAVSQKQPGLGMTELSKIVAKMYHGLSDRKKMKYTEMAEKQKEAYQAKMKKFMDAHPEYIVPKSKNSSKAAAPKLPTPFKLFSDERFPKLLAEGMSATEAKEQCRVAYKELKDKQKLKWIYQALEAENIYNEEMEKYKAKNPDLEAPAKKPSILTKDELQIKEKHEGKPEKPPNSGYSLFSKRQLSSNALKQFETKERMAEISRLWKELTDEEKTAFNTEVTQLNHVYKMKYASYLETLPADQKNIELLNSVNKIGKRAAAKKEEEPAGKKLKKNLASGLESSDVESGGEAASDEDDFELPQKKTAIQKPNSSLQMFCDTNMEKYIIKHPKLTKQELTRQIAKEFAKLSEEKKEVYGSMARKSKKEMSTTKKSSATTASKAKTAKRAPASKKATAKPATTVALKFPEPNISPSKKSTENSDVQSSKSPSKKSTANSGVQSSKSPSKIKPSLNATAKSSAEMESLKTTQLPPWAAAQSLFKTAKAKEPPKVPESAAAYYAMTHHSKNGNIDTTEIDSLWAKLPEKQKNKYVDEYEKKQKEYVVDFEKFVRSLRTEELKAYRVFMKHRDAVDNEDEEDEANESSDEEESDPMSSNGDDEVSEENSENEEQMTSEED